MELLIILVVALMIFGSSTIFRFLGAVLWAFLVFCVALGVSFTGLMYFAAYLGSHPHHH